VDYLIDNGLPFVVVLTKADKLSKRQREERRAALLTELPCAEDITVIEFSAQSGEGVEDIRSIIEELAESEDEIYEGEE
ncbi:MAG: YihA family ribosome biogenesis GTP-binding protein, partial [Oscillospiraceae bacterium]|nr:YihA family ribosome biogenesis GTP-binding protein [Oscillospiraceae bacterium]